MQSVGDLFLRFGLKQTFVCKYQRAVLSCCQRALAAEVENFIVKVHCALKCSTCFPVLAPCVKVQPCMCSQPSSPKAEGLK